MKNFLETEYGLKIESIKMLSGGFLNKKFLIFANNKKYVYKIISKEKFSESQINSFILLTFDLENFLNSKLIKTPMIINSNNSLITEYQGNIGFLMEYEDGTLKTPDTITPNEMYSLGVETAKLHVELKNYHNFPENYNYLKLKSISELYDDYENRLKSANNNLEYLSDISNHKKIIMDIKKTSLLKSVDKQLIHGDFASDNILFKDDEVLSIIDYELVRYNTKLQDIGRVILSYALNNGTLNINLINCFIKGYNKINCLKKKDIVNAIKIVWINEVNLWCKESYYRNYNPDKVIKFMDEIKWITKNWFNLGKIINREGEV